MKLSITIAAALVVGIASASPVHANKKRDIDVVRVVEESYVTITEWAPEATPEASRAELPAAPPPQPTPAAAPAAPAAAKAAVFNADAPEAGDAALSGLSVVLTPFTGPPEAVGCKTPETVNKEFDDLIAEGFINFRYHGTACDQVRMANAAAHRTNTELFLGAFDLRNVVAETQELIRQVRASGGWDRVRLVALGNEDLSKGMSAEEVLRQIQIGTDMLRADGYTRDIVHPETVDNVLNNAALMCSPAAGTKLAVNIFPFNNPNVTPDGAGAEAARQAELVSRCSQMYSSRVPGNDLVISEEGWPGAAESNNGAAVASPDAQIRAISNMLSTVPAEQYLFTAFDHKWQRDFPGSHGAEQHYGLFGKGYKWNWPHLRTVRSRLVHIGRV